MPKPKKTLAEQTREFIEKDITPKAERLAEVRKLLTTREDRFKEETDNLYEEELALKGILIIKMKEAGMKSVRVSSGENIAIGPSRSVEVLSESKCMQWAIDHRFVTINKTMIKQELTKLANENAPMPDFVRVNIGETITIKNPADKSKK